MVARFGSHNPLHSQVRYNKPACEEVRSMIKTPVEKNENEDEENPFAPLDSSKYNLTTIKPKLVDGKFVYPPEFDDEEEDGLYDDLIKEA